MTVEKRTVLDRRLLAAASLVRQGAFFADIGTDHAYLPLFLVETGRVTRAIASDINEGPAECARLHIAAAGLADKIEVRVTGGLSGLDALGLTDIAVCGMGGELIRDILAAAPFVRDANIRLILQPMSRVEVLRRYLAKEGFEIIEERRAQDGDKLYVCMAVTYSGVPRSLSLAEALLGKPNPADPLFRLDLRRRLAAAEKRREGKEKGKDGCVEAEIAEITALSALLEEL